MQKVKTIIDEFRAIEIARAAAVAQGWAFAAPIQCTLRRSWLQNRPTRWEVRSSSGSKGSVSRFVVDAETGCILEQGYVPR